jgi:DNA-binding Lrp family transcriptional regulator
MTKEKFANNKKLKTEINERRKEILEELEQKIIEVSDCDFDGNSTCIFLTNNGYVYKEYNKYGSYNYDIELVGYIDSKKIDELMRYLLADEKILKRKNTSFRKMSGICDYNVLISFYFKNKEHSIPDDIFCSNNHVSTYSEGCLSSRIESKLLELVQNSADHSDYLKREELRKELKQIDIFLEKYGEEKEFEIPDFLKRKSE